MTISTKKMVFIGSGMHRHFLGCCPSPLSDWTCILTRLAKERSVELPRSCYSNPTVAWERLITEVSRKSGEPQKKAAYIIEHELKKSVADFLKKDQAHHAEAFAESVVGKKLHAFIANGGHLVSLNFDQLAYLKMGKRPSFPRLMPDKGKVQSHLLYKRTRIKANDNTFSMIWHPHGSIINPGTIRLGFRDYGLMPNFYEAAFGHYKAWETQCLSGTKWESDSGKGEEDKECHAFLLGKLAELDRETKASKFCPADTWVTRFMLLPVVFIGVGLSREEIGLHWLLAQRERNFLKRKRHPKPVIVRENQAEDRPFGVTYKDCDSWDAAWDSALA